MGIFGTKKTEKTGNGTGFGRGKRIRMRDPRRLKYYAYNLLSTEKKELYFSIWKNLRAFKTEFTIPKKGLSADDVYNLIKYVLIDHPGIFWLNNRGCVELSHTQDTYFIKPIYNMTRAEAQRRKKEINEAVLPFVKSIKKNKGDYEVVKLAYENIINLIDYDSIGLEKQHKMGDVEKTTPDDLRSIYGVFVNKKAVCAGYAKATQYLLNRLGIECAYVRGYTQKDGQKDNDNNTEKDKSGYHAWNLLKLEGDYYYLDTTWGDSSDTLDEPGQKSAEQNLDYDYFCIDTKTLLLDHTPDEDPKVPVCTATSCNYYVREGLILSSYSRDAIKKIIKKELDNNKHIIRLMFANDNSYNQAKTNLIDDGEMWKIIDELIAKGVKIKKSYRYINKDNRKQLTLFMEQD